MNRNVKRCPNAMVSLTAYAREVVARAASRIQGWFRRPDLEQLNREPGLRLQERLRERARVARELHEALFQGFLGVSLQLNHAAEQAPADSPGKPSFGRALRLMQRVTDEGRDTPQGLRSSDVASMSLEQALSVLRDEFTPAGVRFRIFVMGRPKKLSPAIQEQIYLIGREATLNAMRHARATRIEAEVVYLPRGLRLAVRDNGCGIDTQAVRSGRDCYWGLLGMRDRAGSIGAKLRIWSGPGAGTEVEISVPGNILAEART
jgi:signal transduction histidine kinase